MNVVEMYDYYFLTDAQRRFDDRCEFGVCKNNIVYRRMQCAVSECKRTAEFNGHCTNDSERNDTGVDAERENWSGGDVHGLSDVLEYMLYNVSGDIGLPAHYSCCMYFYKKADDENIDATTTTGYAESGHVCNAIPIMIGSRLEQKIVKQLAKLLGVQVSHLYDAEYLHKVYSGAFLVNGTFYYSVFRESNNNKICHNSKSKYRGDETVAYFYDKTCNRGVKLFTDQLGQLRINDRDGMELTEVTSDVMLQLYEECVPNSRHYSLDMGLIKGFFSSVKELGLAGIDDFKNKIYTNYSIGLNTFLDKLPLSAMRNPMWNSSLMVGKVNSGISQRLSYPKSKSETKKLNEQKLKMCTGGMSTGYLVETQRRRNTRKPGASKAETRQNGTTDNEVGQKRKHVQEDVEQTGGQKRKKGGDFSEPVSQIAEVVKTPPCPVQSTVSTKYTILGSKDIKTSGLLEKLEQGERNGPSTFNQVSVSYLPLIRVLSNTVQKLQVEHVHAESSKTVPRDAYGFICMKYMGNISTAGKNMLFADRVQVAYGHVQDIVDAIERGLDYMAHTSREDKTTDPLVLFNDSSSTQNPTGTTDSVDRMYIVINNAVTSWTVPRHRLIEFLVFLKTKCHQYAWIKLIGRYLCVYYYEGVPLLRYERDEMMFQVLKVHTGGNRLVDSDVASNVDCMFFSRDELELLASIDISSDASQRCSKIEHTSKTNKLIDRWFMRCHNDGGIEIVDHSSILAKQLNQYTDYTAPAKRSVSVNARKSACTNVYYQRAAEMIRGFSIFVDPDAYEQSTAKQVNIEHGVPEWVTLRDFARTRRELDNCPQPQYSGDTNDNCLANFYMVRTVFADIAGYNVEDANVLDSSVDLHLSFSYSFSLTFVDRTKSGLDIIVPPAKNAASVCCWDADGNPTTVMFMVCTIRKKCDNSDCSDDTDDLDEMLSNSTDVRMVLENNSGKNSGSNSRRQYSAAKNDSLAFPPFRKLSVVRSEDGIYHVFFMRNDAVLLRTLRRMRSEAATERPNMSNAVRLAENDYLFVCKPEVNPYDAVDYMRTNITTFEVNAGERVVTIDTRVRGTSDKYDGVKIVNSFGQKGLALIKDLKPYFGHCPVTSCNVPVQLVMNNCSFVSRQPIGQYLQMKKNMFAVTNSTAGEPTSVGYTAVFFTETEPVTKSCLVRFDEMMRSVIITLGMSTFQNLKSSQDNVYNPYGLLYPPQTRQILSLYRCVGVAYNFTGDTTVPYASREEVQQLLDIYDVYSRTPKPIKPNNNNYTIALLDVLDVLCDEKKTRRLMEIGVLSTEKEDSECLGLVKESKKRMRDKRVLRLHGQWIRGLVDSSIHSGRSGTGTKTKPDFVLRTYDSVRRKFETVYLYGEPNFIIDALDDKYASIDRFAEFVNTDEENLYI